MIPAVHWFVERVQRPDTGIGSIIALPEADVPVVRLPPLSSDPPESLNVSAFRSPPTHFCDVRQAPVPCS